MKYKDKRSLTYITKHIYQREKADLDFYVDLCNIVIIIQVII